MKVMKLEKRKCFSLYINGEAVKIPQKPYIGGDLIQYKDGMLVSLGDTVRGKELTWFCVQFDTGAEVWFCNRNLMNLVDFDCLNSIGLVEKKIQIEGLTMNLSLPSLGDCKDADCEWTALMDFLDNDPKNSFHWKNCFSFEKNTADVFVTVRGYSGARYWNNHISHYYYYYCGWRPALRILTTSEAE